MFLKNLDSESVRKFMLEEINFDINREKLYMSKRMRENHEDIYTNLLIKEVDSGTPESLSKAILDNNCLVEKEKTIRGFRKVPYNAHETLGEGEFNRFYMRGLSKKAIDENLELKVYRAKKVSKPRKSSEELLDNIVSPEEILEDFRKNPGKHTNSELADPNSGLSLKIV